MTICWLSSSLDWSEFCCSGGCFICIILMNPRTLCSVLAGLLLLLCPCAAPAQEYGAASPPDTTAVRQVEMEEAAGVLLPAFETLALPKELEKEMPAKEKEFILTVRPDFQPASPPLGNFEQPAIRNICTSGLLGQWNGIRFIGSGLYEEHPALLVTKAAGLGAAYNYGGLSVAVDASATRYVGPIVNSNQWGIGADISYRFSPSISVTAFGQYFTAVPVGTMAAYSFVNSSRYGGYVSYMGDRVGIDVGAQRYMDPYTMRWVTAPIVTPKVRLWDNVTIGVPVGGLIQREIERRNMKNGPPPPPPPPHRR